MKSPQPGKNTSVSVENITPFGVWLFVNEQEYFLSYENYPYFQDQTLQSIQNVQLYHGYHLYWPELDVDLEIDNLEIKVFEKETTWKAAKNQSQEQAERLAIMEAQRQAIEEAGVFISSLTAVKDLRLANDEITQLASGILQTKTLGVRAGLAESSYWTSRPGTCTRFTCNATLAGE